MFTNKFFSIKHIVIIVLLSFSAHHSSAALLNLTTTTPSLNASTVTLDYLENAGDGDLSTFSALIDSAVGVSTNGITQISLGVGFDLLNPVIGATGGFSIEDQSGTFLSGDSIQGVGYDTDQIQFQFSNLSGSGANSFNSSILMDIVFDNSLGTNPFNTLADGNSYSASVSVSNVVPVTTVVPEPKTWLLVILGLLVLNRFKFLPIKNNN